LREAASIFEGVRVFVKSDDEHTAGKGKAVQNLIGGIYGVRFAEGQGADSGALIGTFRPIDPSDAVVTKMTEAVKRGMANLMGLSIDAVAKTITRMQGATRLREAMAQVMTSPDVLKAFETSGSLVAYQDAPAFAQFVAVDSARLITAVKKIGKVE
jgi:hypothetical protein